MDFVDFEDEYAQLWSDKAYLAPFLGFSNPRDRRWS